MSVPDVRNGLAYASPGQRLLGFIAVYGPAFVMFVLPALVNGFPLLFNDTGTYLRAGIERYNPADRPVYYAILLFLLHWQLSLWPIVLVQAAGTLAVLAIFFNHALAPLPRPQLGLLLFLSGALSSLPFFTSQIMPDLFTPLMVVALCSLVFYRASLGSMERGFLFLVVLASVMFHQANFVIAGMTLVSAWLFRLITTRRPGALRPFLMPCLAVALGVVLLLLPNFIAHRMLTTTRAGSVFFLAKVIDDGPGLDYLTEICPSRHYSICPAVPAIRHYEETTPPAIKALYPTSDFVLWQGPVVQAGGWNGVTPYAGAVSMTAIRHQPAAFARASLQGFTGQLLHFATGDGVTPVDKAGYLVEGLRLHFPLGVADGFLHSRQQTNDLHFAAISLFDQAMVVLGCLMLIGLLLVGAEPALAAIAFTFVAAIIGNALVTGVLSAVHDRYQSRIVSLVIIAALALAADRLRSRHIIPSA
jgi:hypothetical protein